MEHSPGRSAKSLDTLRISHFLIILAALISLLAASLVFFHKLQREDYLVRLKARERYALSLQRQIITRRFEDIIADLLFLARQNELLELLESPSSKRRGKMAREYLAFLDEKRIYDQIRYLDRTGMEIVRVDLDNGTPKIVEDQALQSKKARYYFQDAMSLDHGRIFISPLDLNVEQGRIERPLKPIIRFATPVFDKKGAKRGLVILNYLGEKLLVSIRNSSKTTLGIPMLLNSRGFWLLGPTPSDEWGFMIPERKKRTFPNDYPGIWRVMQDTSSGQIHQKNGLFSFTTVTPLSPLSRFRARTRTSSGSSSPSGGSAKKLQAEEYYWKLASLVPNEVIQHHFRGLGANLFVLAVILSVLAALPAWLMAQALASRKNYREKLYHMAHYDSLTRVPNRMLFLDRLEQAMRQAVRYQRRFGLIYVDMDNFKKINDSHGHNAGDQLLRKTAERLRECTRRSDTVGRMGGDEFTVLLAGLEGRREAEIVVRKILGSLAKPFSLGGTECRIDISIGVSLYPEDGTDPETLLKKADSAMYEAKGQEGSAYLFFS